MLRQDMFVMGTDNTSNTPNTKSMDIMTEAQAIRLRKVTAIAILSELGHYYKDKGDDKGTVLRKMDEQINKTIDTLMLPTMMRTEILTTTLNNIYTPVSRKQRMLATMIEGIREINKEDNGGEDAGMGLPPELKTVITRMESWDKVLDETNDLVVDATGNKFVQTSLANMKSHLPKDFVDMFVE